MTIVQRHGVTLASALALAAIAPKLYAQTTRIAIVDLQRALVETEDGRRAKSRIERLAKRQQKELDQRQDALKAQKEQIERALEKSPDGDDAIRERVAEYQKALAELQTKYTEYQRELAELEAQLTRPIVERMQRILRRMGQTDGYETILERNQGGVIWAPAHLDLTDRLIQRYNAGEGREGEPSDEGAPPRRRTRATKRR